MNDSSIKDQLVPLLPETAGQYINANNLWASLEEIRLRQGRPVQLIEKNREIFLNDHPICILSPELLKAVFQKLSRYSAYAVREEIREGFITLPGGHRAGLCGRVYFDGEGCRQLKDITSINIRIARARPGCSDHMFRKLFRDKAFYDTLIISPPGYGKTTFLRDIICHLSDGGPDFPGVNVSVVDERGEIAACSAGREAFYLGKRTDVLDRCPKASGMLMMLRTMNPSVIAADEIGSDRDIEALKVIRNSGCGLLMTAHGKDLDDVLNRPSLGSYIKKHPFGRYIVIRKTADGRRQTSLYDDQGKLC